MSVAKLRPDEAVQIDYDRLRGMEAKIGRREAEDLMLRAMEELALRMERVGHGYRAGDIGAVAKAVRSMAAIADEAGLTTFATVAASVKDVAARQDYAAIAACVERLLRVGENSLIKIWDIRGMSV